MARGKKKKSWLRKLKELLPIFQEIFSQLSVVFTLIGWTFGVVLLVYWFFIANSKTSVAFLSADTNVIHIHVSNDGLRPSTLRGYRLKFPDLPFDEAPLELIMADQQKGRVPRLQFNLKRENPSIDAGGVDLGLIVGGVSSHIPGLKDEEVLSKLRTGHATVEIDVQEAKDPPEGPWHVRSDTVDAMRLHHILMRKIR